MDQTFTLAVLQRGSWESSVQVSQVSEIFRGAMAWEHLEIPQEELKIVARKRDARVSLLDLLCLQPDHRYSKWQKNEQFYR